MTIGQTIRSLRKEQRISQKELGKRTFMGQSEVSRVERDLRLPNVEQIGFIAVALGVSPILLCKAYFGGESDG